MGGPNQLSTSGQNSILEKEEIKFLYNRHDRLRTQIPKIFQNYSTVLLYTNNIGNLENRVPFTIINEIDFCWWHLQDRYAENYKTNERKGSLSNWRDILCSWKTILLILPKWSSGFNSNPVKVTAGLFVEIGKLFTNLYGNVPVLQVFETVPLVHPSLGSKRGSWHLIVPSRSRKFCLSQTLS